MEDLISTQFKTTTQWNLVELSKCTGQLWKQTCEEFVHNWGRSNIHISASNSSLRWAGHKSFHWFLPGLCICGLLCHSRFAPLQCKAFRCHPSAGSTIYRNTTTVQMAITPQKKISPPLQPLLLHGVKTWHSQHNSLSCNSHLDHHSHQIHEPKSQ